METLLSVSFDNISSRDSSKIRKGLRQIEGLIAQICLPRQTPRSPHKKKPQAFTDKDQSSPKNLEELKSDPAFREFFRLQEGFQWNVASRLISTLERLMGMGNPSQTDLLILSALDLLQGILLLHPPSRSLFTREITLNLLLDLLDAANNPPKVQSQALLVLVAALLDHPHNTRLFESIDGLLTVTSLFKSSTTTKDVKLRSLEFLYFYLMPEAPPVPITQPQQVQHSTVPPAAKGPSKIDLAFGGHARTHSGDGGAMEIDSEEWEDETPEGTRSTLEKQRTLGRYLNNVAELVQDLHENAPFGIAAERGLV